MFYYSGISQMLAERIRSKEGQILPVFYEPCENERNTHKDMAGKITSMSKIKQSLLLHRQGYSLRRIAESLGGISKNTVNEYLRQIDMHGYDIDELLQLSDMELESKFHPGNPVRFSYEDTSVAVKRALLCRLDTSLVCNDILHGLGQYFSKGNDKSHELCDRVLCIRIGCPSGIYIFVIFCFSLAEVSESIFKCLYVICFHCSVLYC